VVEGSAKNGLLNHLWKAKGGVLRLMSRESKTTEGKELECRDTPALQTMQRCLAGLSSADLEKLHDVRVQTLFISLTRPCHL
jgi:hypothetical protein